MKIWCDSCNKTEASIFCSADEAALCDDCDLRVHQANKLASKHQRFSLLQSSSSSSSSSSNGPQCDICQEKKALLFCQQDRAILCRDCDISIHTANELTSKHNRFLLTGAKLSSIKNKAKCDSEKTDHWSKSFFTEGPFMSDSVHLFNSNPQQSDSVTITQSVNNQQTSEGDCGFTSSISEYLMEMLPGWQVEDLLDSSSDPDGFYKDSDDNGLLFFNCDVVSKISSYENNGLWVPQAPNVLQPSLPLHSGICGVKGKASRKVARKKMDDVFTVPQISTQSKGSKRSRPICK
ncbi:hypothetical protein V2J09_007231 [Rumex salicifolius]